MSDTSAAHNFRNAVFKPEQMFAWILSDGKAGHEAQCRGVVEALGVAHDVKRVDPSGLGKWLAPWGPAADFTKLRAAGGPLAPPWPQLVFATGRQTIPYLRAIGRYAGEQTFTVALMDPKTGRGTADVIWVPEHDRLRGPNVLSTVTMPNVYSATRLADLRRQPMPPALVTLPLPRIAVLIGGPNGSYRFEPSDIARLIDDLKFLAASGAGLMITSSRRTPMDIQTAIADLAVLSNVYVWDGTGINPYPQFVARADHFVVTADSVAMASEAAATGRPVHIFRPSGSSAKFDRFHAELRRLGVTRPLQAHGNGLATWQYQPLHAAETIAATIVRTWSERQRLT